MVTHGTKSANQMTLEQGDDSGFSGWALCKHKVLSSWKREAEEVRRDASAQDEPARCNSRAFTHPLPVAVTTPHSEFWKQF